MFVFGCNMTHNANMISYMIVQFWHWVEWKKKRCFWGVLVECAGFLPAKPVQLMCGLNSEGCLFYIINSPAVTFGTLHPVYLLASFWTGRGRRWDRVYRKVFGKWAVGFWSEGGAWATMVGGRGISESAFVTCTLFLIQQEGEWASECAKEVDIPKDERLTLTSDAEIRPLSYTSDG